MRDSEKDPLTTSAKDSSQKSSIKTSSKIGTKEIIQNYDKFKTFLTKHLNDIALTQYNMKYAYMHCNVLEEIIENILKDEKKLE